MPERLLAVTTRSRLRRARHFPAVLLANRRIRRQLAAAEGLACWASLVAGPTEFWTVTVWRSRDAMQEFARSAEHGEIMWRFSRWLRSLWLMRWRPGPAELGEWAGRALAAPDPPEAAPAVPGPLAGIPTLAAALDADGVPGYAGSAGARRDRRRVAGAAGVLVRIEAGPWRAPAAVRAVLRLRRRLRAEPDVLRVAVGVGRGGEAFLLGVRSDRAAAEGFVHGPWCRAARERWGGRLWAAAWVPEGEFGHWDGLRLRRIRSRLGPRGAQPDGGGEQ